MKIKFKCPQCESIMHSEASTTATDIRDRKCRTCGARWRFKITPIMHKNGVTVHTVENTARFDLHVGDGRKLRPQRSVQEE